MVTRFARFLSIFLLLSLSHASKSQDFDEFIMSCSEGNVETMKKLVAKYPDFATRQTEQGESCLHVAGILGQAAITKEILKAGADPNVRSTFSEGLRMTPLSWNVYGGHVDTARALLEGGAKVNMDVDDMKTKEKVTVLDILHNNILHQYEDNEKTRNDAFVGKHLEMKDLLLKYGAKFFSDLDEPEL